MTTTFNETLFNELTADIEFSAVLTGDDYNAETPEGRLGQNHWRVKLTRGNYAFETEYHQGSAHRTKPSEKLTPNAYSIHNAMILNKTRPTAPQFKDVLWSLYMDSTSADQPFDDWCADYGMDTDSRKAEASYNACRDEMFALRKLGLDMEKLAELYQNY